MISQSARAIRLRPWPLVLMAGLAVLPVAAGGQTPMRYAREEYLIPMRDGVRLDTIVYEPVNPGTDYPILLERTPYAIRDHLPPPVLAQAGYIIALQSVRGRYGSQGSFVQMRPELASHANPRAVDASTDSYDTITWLVNHVQNNNHRVGLLGTSYPGFYATAGMIDAPPELKAVSPQAPQTDWFVGDDIHHDGALMLDTVFGGVVRCLHQAPAPYSSTVCSDSAPDEVFEPEGFNYGTPDGYQFFLEHEPLEQLTKLFGGSVPWWTQVMTHGTYDTYWRSRDILPHLRSVKPAILDVGGWYDANDLYGALHVSDSLASQSPTTSVTLVMGPWYHGQWWEEGGQPSDLVASASSAAVYYQNYVLLPFFAHYLKGAPNPDLPRALAFDTGANAWSRFDHWPPAPLQKVHLYLRADGVLSLEPPTAAEPSTFDQYVSDPKSPVPYTPTLSTNLDDQYMERDQRFLARRPDVQVYESEPLTSDITIAGPIVARLFASTSGTDSDWVVRLIDVYPETAPVFLPSASQIILPADQSERPGFELLVRGDGTRGKFRGSLEHPQPMVPGKITPITVGMDDVLHTFKRGHRIVVAVQSTWFPLFDLNPQTFVDIYTASHADFRPATERIYHSERYPSSLELGTIPTDRQPER